MKNLLFATGATVSALGLIATTPVQASTRTYDFDAVTSVSVEFEQLWVGQDLNGFTVPNRIDVIAQEMIGSFTVLDDPAQITDGDIEFNSGLFENLLGDSYDATLTSFLGGFGLTSSQLQQSVDGLFNITGFTGGGELVSQDPALAGDPDNPSGFDITYNNATNSVLVDGYDTDVATSCLSAVCEIEGGVTFGVSLVVSEFITFTGNLLNNSNVTLTPETRNALTDLLADATLAQQLLNITEIDLATVSAGIEASTVLASVDPNGSAADIGIDITSGSLLAVATTGDSQEVLFSQQWEPAPTLDVPVDNSGGGSGTETPGSGPIDVPGIPSNGGSTPQGVPEPSMLLGFLGAAAFLVKQGKQKMIVR